MKKLSQMTMLLLGLMVAFAGCDSAKKAAEDAKDKAADMADMADIDFGDFDMKGLQSKFSAITDGFKDVTADNVDGLTSKITDLGGSLEGLGIDKLPGPAKDFAMNAIKKFGESITTAMGGISDEGILGKLKPVVDMLMEKMKAFQ